MSGIMEVFCQMASSIGSAVAMFFTFPEDARWNADRQAVEFGVEIGEYHGVERIPRRVFQRLLPDTPYPRALRRSVPLAANTLRESRRAKDAAASVDRGRERRDH